VQTGDVLRVIRLDVDFERFPSLHQPVVDDRDGGVLGSFVLVFSDAVQVKAAAPIVEPQKDRDVSFEWERVTERGCKLVLHELPHPVGVAGVDHLH
jgi:hypothetical protein